MHRLIGKLLADRYELQEVLEDFAEAPRFGTHDLVQRRNVELRILDPTWLQPRARDAFYAHCEKICLRLQTFTVHGLIELHDWGIWEDRVYLISDPPRGESLAKTLRKHHRLPFEMMTQLIEQLSAILAKAHECGVLHLDLNPNKIYLTRSDDGLYEASLADTGLIQMLTAEESRLSIFTKTGRMLGDARYAAPETLTYATPDRRSDIYALGALVYELLSGSVPFPYTSTMDLIVAHINESPRPLRAMTPGREFPEKIAQALEAALQKLPANRPGSALEFAKSLRLFEDCEPGRSSTLHFLAGEHISAAEESPSAPCGKLQAGEIPGSAGHLSKLSSLTSSASHRVLALFALFFLFILAGSLMNRHKYVHNLPRQNPIHHDADSLENARASFGGDLPASQRALLRNPTNAIVSEALPEFRVSPLSAEDLNTSSTSFPEFGISVRQITPELASTLNLGQTHGIIVTKVMPGEPAQMAGMQVRDIIVKVETKGQNILVWNPRPVETLTAFHGAVSDAKAGGVRIALVIKRGAVEGLVTFLQPELLKSEPPHETKAASPGRSKEPSKVTEQSAK